MTLQLEQLIQEHVEFMFIVELIQDHHHLRIAIAILVLVIMSQLIIMLPVQHNQKYSQSVRFWLFSLIMKQYIYLILLLTSFSISCSEENPRVIKIQANIKSIPADKIYLSNAYRWNEFLDSSNYTGGVFSFTLDSTKFSEPFLASLSFLNDKGIIEQLPIINYINTTERDTFSSTAFMLKYGQNELSGDYKNRFHRVILNPNSENNLYFRLGTGRLSSKIPIEQLKDLIKENRNSYFLLDLINTNRLSYKTSELKNLLLLFDSHLQNSVTARNILNYTNFIVTRENDIPNYHFNSLQNNKQKLFANNSKLHMVIFWASWCGPCRLEIPMLKIIHKTFSDSSFSMISVSIDQDMEKWKEAVREEKMMWEQLVVAQNEYEKVKSQLEITGIPLVLFYDNEKKEIKRIEGFSKDNMKTYFDFIESFLIKQLKKK